jgi:hypothetical protein
MEKAVYFSDINKLRSHNFDYDRIYFGNEFCDELIPSLDDLKFAISVAKEKNKDLSFVTCYVSEYKIKKYYHLLNTLAGLAPRSEVIINDWGVLGICLQNNLTPVLGRLLVRQKRDPRISFFMKLLPDLSRLRVHQTGLNNYFKDFLKTQSINRIELDNLIQGIDMNELQDVNFGYSVYIPYGYVTTTRICFFRNKNISKNKRFSILPCINKSECGLAKLYNKQIKDNLFMRGNTIFFKNTSQSFLKLDSRINRIVHEPEIPD